MCFVSQTAVTGTALNFDRLLSYQVRATVITGTGNCSVVVTESLFTVYCLLTYLVLV